MKLSRPSFWAKRNLTSWLLFPVSLIFQIIVWGRKCCYRLNIIGAWHSPAPVIVVGNISVGGAGKTPLVIALSEILISKNLTVGIVTRGYGGSGVEQPVLVKPDSDAALVGDESVLLAQRCQATVVAGANRVQAVKFLLSQDQVDLVLCDDGLQHYALERDVEIAVVDSQFMFGNAFCLPAGPLREPVSRLKSVDMLVFSGSEKGYTLQGTELVSVNNTVISRPIASMNLQRVHAIAGIASPDRFFQFLRDRGIDVIEHPFGDHAFYLLEDLNYGDDYPLVMTEKDMVKCRHLGLENSWYVPVTAVLNQAVADEFMNLVNRVLLQRKNNAA